MKIPFTVTLLLLAGISGTLLADGLPIEDGKITSPHTLFTLSDSQVEELDALGSVTLSKSQWAQLRKVSSAAGKRITPIVGETYNDCSCHLGSDGGILMKNGQLAVLHGDTSASSLARQISARPKLTLRVDRRGQFYFDGKLIRFEMLLEAINASTPFDPAERSRELIVLPPPLISSSDKVFEDRIVRVKNALEEKGWKVFR